MTDEKLDENFDPYYEDPTYIEFKDTDESKELDKLLFQHLVLNETLAKLEEEKEQLRLKINILMKENKLTKYVDGYNNSITLSPFKRETLDKEGILKEFGLDRCKPFLRVSEGEMLKITSAENKERMKKFIEGKKK